MPRQLLAACGVLVLGVVGLAGQARRPLAIEDYYRVLTMDDQPHGISGHWNNVHRMIKSSSGGRHT